MENTKEKHVKHFLVVYILHKKITSVSKLTSPYIKPSFISIFSLNTDSFQNLQYINTDYGLKTHQSLIKKTRLSPRFSTDFSVSLFPSTILLLLFSLFFIHTNTVKSCFQASFFLHQKYYISFRKKKAVMPFQV